MTQKIVGLDGYPADEPNEDVIELLEELLTKAKTGQIQAISMAYLSPGETCGTCWSHGSMENGLILIGATHRLAARITREGLAEGELL